MEYVIALFAGIWIAVAGVVSYVRIAKDYKEISDAEDKNK